MKYGIYVCEDGPECPNDKEFEHRFYFGCVPKDFVEKTGRSKSYKQVRGTDNRYHWNGGCDREGNET